MSLFSFYYIQPNFSFELALVLIIWHFLVFPSSNGYNSYHDQDEGPIGALKAPPKPTTHLLLVANVMDVLAILLSLLVNIPFTVLVITFIIVSRVYSNRKIRLKKYPVAAFLIVCLCQGTGVFCANILGLSSATLFSNTSVVYSAVACYFFIGTIYPLTQIYQHESDAKDGVTTMSMLLGKKGTFIFAGLFFTIATFCVYLSFKEECLISNFWIFLSVMSPAAVYFLIWGIRSFRDSIHVNFKNTMIMLVLSSLLNNIFFTILLIR
tara:strand:- start:2562 stop:3359 length:798 start_codon:yes stop_codon:yes gene_type:complete